MPDQPNDPTTTDSTPDPSSAPTGSTPPADTRISLTPEELQQAIASAVQSTLAAQPPAPAPEPVRQEPQDPYGNINDDDYLEGRTVKGILANVDTRFKGFEQAVQHLYTQNVGNLELLSRQANATEWEKYGKEIKDIVEENKKTQVVDANTYENAIAVVRGRHVQDLVQEGVQQYLQNAPQGDITTTGGGGTPVSGEPIELPENYKRWLAENQLSIADIQRSLDRRKDHYGEHATPTLIEYIEQMVNSKTIQDGRQFKSFDLTEK